MHGQTKSEHWRRIQLKRIRKLIEENEKEILNALGDDLEKPETEAFFEIIGLLQELKVAEDNLKNWMKPEKIKVPLSLMPGEAKVISEPLGSVLIIGAWNYPFLLTLQPLICALAAGNTAVLKPSEFAPSTSKLIEKLISKYFPNDIVIALEGDGDFTQELLDIKFDHIFFTGGTNIGAKILAGASKHLTPVTLELGGKNPAIVLEGSDIDVTARRLIWGKGLNSGQTCLAPNHVLVLEEMASPLINSFKKQITDFYGDNPIESPNLAKLNIRQFEKTSNLLEKAFKKKQVIFGGAIDSKRSRISPTLISIDHFNDPILKDELFGPLMPIKKIPNLDTAITNIQSQSKPLAIYLFGGSSIEQETIVNKTSSGSICFNDVVLQAGIPELPFGGVGASGMGRYHGKSGFDTFSNKKSILKRPFWLDIKFRYPPYRIDISFLKKLLS